MSDTQQPEALQLAYALSGGKLIDDSTEWADTLHAAEAELLRQHARIAELEDVADMAIKRIAELEAQLAAIGAGGVEPLRKQDQPAAAPQAVPASVIAGAIYDFAGYLTTLPHKEAIHCSEAHEAPPMVKAITEWCNRRGLCTADARVKTWREAIAAQAKQGGE